MTAGPVLLVPPGPSVPDTVTATIARLSPTRVIALGGAAAVSDAALRSAAAGRPTERYAGGSRYETAVAISQAAFPSGAERVFLARADVFADAVAGGSLTGGPILLVSRCGQLPAAVASELRRLKAPRVYALGGTAAVCDAVLQDAASVAPPSEGRRPKNPGAKNPEAKAPCRLSWMTG